MKPDHIVVPDQLTTERLVLRAPREGDAPQVNRAVHESFDVLHEWMHWATHLPTVDETEAFQKQARDDFRHSRQFSFNTYLRSDDTFIGIPALFNVDWSVPKLEIGYWLRTGFERRGLMTEAIKALTDLALNGLGMRRVEIRADPRNRRSTGVAERAGFTLEGVLRNEQPAPSGGLRDTAVYAVIR